MCIGEKSKNTTKQKIKHKNAFQRHELKSRSLTPVPQSDALPLDH